MSIHGSTSNLKNIEVFRDFKMSQFSQHSKSKAFGDDIQILLDAIYAKYDFKFCCNFKGNGNLKLLSFAKPLIQYYVDLLTTELVSSKNDYLLKGKKIEDLVNAFTPMYTNRLSRVSSEILNEEFENVLESVFIGWRPLEVSLDSYINEVQNKSYMIYLHRKYPNLFCELIEVSHNWLTFVLDFSHKLPCKLQKSE